VLDCGCGNGILSIVASKHGAESVVAYDIDEWSVENTKHNAQLNGVENIDVLLGDINVLSHVSGVFDIIVANINRNILLTDMPTMKGVMAENGKLIISGFYKEDVALLKERASELGLQMESMKELANWVSLSFSS
jgi:ribosomal protein L11 methyltransferase